MKKQVFILSFLLIFTFIGNAQTSDSLAIIFPVNGQSIKNCHIIHIENGNLIHYAKGQDTASVLAKTYIQNGKGISVFPLKDTINGQAINYVEQSIKHQQEFDYHDELNKLYKKRARIGVPFLGAGVLLVTSGIGIYYHGGSVVEHYFEDGKEPGIFLMVMGGINLAAGGTIIGINLSKAKKHKELANQSLRKKDLRVQVGMNDNGLGLAIRF